MNFPPRHNLLGSPLVVWEQDLSHPATLATAWVFNNGNKAVRIPAEFRLDTDRVSISRNKAGDLVIHNTREFMRVAGLRVADWVTAADR